MRENLRVSRMDGNNGPVRVLLIEDDPDFAVVMQMKLVSVTKSRFYVEQTNELSAGLKRLTEGGIDVVLLDLNVKDSQGLDTLTRLHSRAPDVPIVVLTGVYDEQLAAQVLSVGAQDYLVKGRFDHEMLVRAIRYSIERMHQEEELRRILTSITSILIGLDSNNRVVHWNRFAEAVFGVPECDVLQKPFRKSGLNLDLDRILQAVAECRAKDVPVRVDDLVFKRADGKEGFLGLTINPMRGHSGEVGGVLIFGADITDRKHTQEALKKANEDLVQNQKKLVATIAELEKAHTELKTAQAELLDKEKANLIGQLAAGIAHEVKNPLAILMQGVDFLDQKVKKDNSNIPSVLKQMTEAITRADYIVKSLLDLSRPEKLEVAPEHLNSILDNALLLSKNYLDRNHIRVVKNFSPELPQVKMDRGKMVGVFINLFTNAVQAMPSGGQLTIQTGRKRFSASDSELRHFASEGFHDGQEIILIDIRDTGSGISKEALPKIFEPFFTTKRGRGGTGLGLSVVKNVLQIHSGAVEIRNRNDGPGAHARLVLAV